MKLKPSDLHALSSPFTNWHADFLAAMEELVGFQAEPDDLLIQLFNEVLPFVKHQYTLYDSIAAVVGCLSELVERRQDCFEPAVVFLSFLLQEPIRERRLLLVDPVQYRYLRPAQTAITTREAEHFATVKAFYSTYRHFLPNASFRIYNDLTLLDQLHPVSVQADDSDRVTWLLADALERYRLGEAFIKDRYLGVQDPRLRDLAAALQGRSFDEQPLYQALEDDVAAAIPWASGRLGAVSGLVLFIADAAQNEARAAQALQSLIELCAALKANRAVDDDDQLTTDQFLLEDLSVYLFREHLSSRQALTPDKLGPQQRLFVDLLGEVYRGHTYTLLYAGVAPRFGTVDDDVGLTSSIYDL
jgi:hypothetical protein